MDAIFQPAVEAIRGGDVDGLRKIVENDPALATRRSARSHPTLLQCLVLDGAKLPAAAQIGMGEILVDAGAPVDCPLIATGSAGNRGMAAFLLERGANLNGSPEFLRGWTVLEETLYWGFSEMTRMLLDRGAAVRNLRIAAGIGDLPAVEACFSPDGTLDAEHAGTINWPFGKLPAEQQSSEPQELLDHALVYAAMNAQPEATLLLLQRGAAIQAMPRGFHYRGTALHWTAIRGVRSMCALLIDQGADNTLRDPTFGGTPADWAREGRNEELATFIDSAR